MKKFIALSLFLVSFAGILAAQEIYIRAGSGYNFPVATSVIGENYNYNWVYDGISDIGITSRESVSASYGAGTNFSFAIGYKFNENFILDLNIQYLRGRKYETSNNYYEDYYGEIDIDNEKNTSYSRGIFFQPGITFSVGWGKMAPYAKIGIIAGSPKVLEEEEYYVDDGAINEDYISWEYTGGLALGYQTAVGVNWNIMDKFEIFSELDFVSMSYYAKKGRMTKNIQDGSDILNQMDVYSTQINYEKETDNSTPYDPGEAQIMIRESRPFSFISSQVGIRFKVWKQKDILSGY
ncbi:MAG: outer membrane beta-barrel protein [Bacteroidales bacterium]|nr:outer membrane beta-barrel protein [Bacteroidales bacterium]